MNYFIIKPVSHKRDENMVNGIKKMDPKAAFVKSMIDADVCILQFGWTRSKVCMKEYQDAKERHLRMEEGYLYTDQYIATVNRNRG